jgi:hypothetical protein
MAKITYRLLWENEPKTLRFYEFSEVIKCVDQQGKQLAVKDVVISDADTHTERLVFPFTFRGKRSLANINIHWKKIEGTTTSPLGQNNESTIEPDENYLNRLIENYYRLSEVTHA